jgi:hypothetical protein
MTNPTRDDEDLELDFKRKVADDGTPMRPMGPTNHEGIQTLVTQDDEESDLPKGPTNHEILQTHGRKKDRPTGPTNHELIRIDAEDGTDGENIAEGPTNHEEPQPAP